MLIGMRGHGAPPARKGSSTDCCAGGARPTVSSFPGPDPTGAEGREEPTQVPAVRSTRRFDFTH